MIVFESEIKNIETDIQDFIAPFKNGHKTSSMSDVNEILRIVSILIAIKLLLQVQQEFNAGTLLECDIEKRKAELSDALIADTSEKWELKKYFSIF